MRIVHTIYQTVKKKKQLQASMNKMRDPFGTFFFISDKRVLLKLTV